jgi:hypothetical protein
MLVRSVAAVWTVLLILSLHLAPAEAQLRFGVGGDYSVRIIVVSGKRHARQGVAKPERAT